MSNYAFLAFNCQGFDGDPFGAWQERVVLPEGAEQHFLMADYNIYCYSESPSGDTVYSPEYASIRTLAILAIVLYPIGVPLAFAALLISCRRELHTGRPITLLSRALKFLYREYETQYYYWEIVVS